MGTGDCNIRGEFWIRHFDGKRLELFGYWRSASHIFLGWYDQRSLSLSINRKGVSRINSRILHHDDGFGIHASRKRSSGYFRREKHLAVYVLDDHRALPPAMSPTMEGIIAVGGRITSSRIHEGYLKGIFPWTDSDEFVMWYAPDDRMVLFPGNLKIRKSTRQLLNQQNFSITVDQCFQRVIESCRDAYRPGQDGTWITPDCLNSFLELHTDGVSHSVEVWEGNQLVGGLFGSIIGKMFYGESMFSARPNASKIGFILWASKLFELGIELIDCQVYNDYLASFGAEEIPRFEFVQMNARYSVLDKIDVDWKNIRLEWEGKL